MTTQVVNVKDYKPYSLYWNNQSPDSPYIYIGRAVPYQIPIDSKWCNPFRLKDKNDMIERHEVIRKYKEYILANSELMNQLHELKDKVLGCWCKPLPCHGDILAELADNS